MPRLQGLTDLQLRRTPGALLTFAILGHIAKDSELQPLINHAERMKFIPGEPPKRKELPAPAVYCWPNRDLDEVQGEDSLESCVWYFNVKVILKNLTPVSPINMNADGTFKKPFPLDPLRHTALFEIFFFKQRLKYILNEHGHHNNWYYAFVQNGLLGENNQIQYDMREFGGGDTKSPSTYHLTLTFRIKTWDHRNTLLMTGDATVYVENGLGGPAVQGATVSITDKNGNAVEDSSGNTKWTTNVSGEASITGLLATANTPLTISATKSGTGSGTISANISQTASDNSFTVTLS